MPTKRRPLKHAPRIGEVRVTSRMISLWRQFQDTVRTQGDHDSRVRAAQLQGELHVVLRHLPWEDGAIHEDHYRQLHLLAYPDPKTRPERLDVLGEPA
jgi:hypothetical protein